MVTVYPPSVLLLGGCFVGVIACSPGPSPSPHAQPEQPHHPRIILADAPSSASAGAKPEPKAEPEPEPEAEAEAEPAYALDRMSRKVPMSGSAFCPPIELIDYSGSVVPFHKPLRINKPFSEHVRRFEKIVRDTAVEVYGRPPTRIRHFGSYYCRRITTWPYLVSEHGLGNAIDVGGFDFARLKRDEHPDAGGRWRKSFQVRLSRHWHATGKDAEHSRFLRLLARRVIDREGLFRVILGPAQPGHADHFHLDMAQARIVSVF